MGFMGRGFGSDPYWRTAQNEEERRRLEQQSGPSLDALPIVGGIAAIVLLGVILTILGR